MKKKYNLEGDNWLIINEKKPLENNNNIRREGKEEETVNERLNNNADAKENENIETKIIKKNSKIVDKEGNNIFINKNENESKTKILEVKVEEITEQVSNKNNKSFNENDFETKKEISYEKELNNDKERILTKETKEKNIEKKVKIMCKN